MFSSTHLVLSSDKLDETKATEEISQTSHHITLGYIRYWISISNHTERETIFRTHLPSASVIFFFSCLGSLFGDLIKLIHTEDVYKSIAVVTFPYPFGFSHCFHIITCSRFFFCNQSLEKNKKTQTIIGQFNLNIYLVFILICRWDFKRNIMELQWLISSCGILKEAEHLNEHMCRSVGLFAHLSMLGLLSLICAGVCLIANRHVNLCFSCPGIFSLSSFWWSIGKAYYTTLLECR